MLIFVKTEFKIGQKIKSSLESIDQQLITYLLNISYIPGSFSDDAIDAILGIFNLFIN